MSFFPSNPSAIPEPEEMRRFLEGRVAVAKSAIGAARNVEELKAVTARLLDELDGLFAEGMIRTRASIACSAGCCYCCCLKVDVFPAEAFLLADCVKRNCSEDVRNAVLVKAGQNRAKIAPMNVEQHLGANLPCPLLCNGRCSAYLARPSTCRVFHAQTVQTCKTSFEHPEDMHSPDSQIRPIQLVLGAARMAVAQGYEAFSYDARSYDLNSALLEALRDGKCERRWRDKKRAFPRDALAKDHIESGRDHLTR
jgi:Fe-S-cluster containining protein